MDVITIPKQWNKNSYNQFINELRKLKDNKYLDFNKKIIYTNYEMIGIRIPILRKIVKEIARNSIKDFLKVVKPNTYEEIFIYGIALSYLDNYNNFIIEFNKYIEYIDNWAICDMVLSSLNIISKHKNLYEKDIKKYLKNDNEYIVRVGIVSLMHYYKTKEDVEKIFKYLINIKHNSYYVNMAIAWTISDIYTRYKEETLIFMNKNRLNKEILNMTIQKIRDSKRVSEEAKKEISKYKIKEANQ